MTDTKTVYHDAGVDPMDTNVFLRSDEYRAWVAKHQPVDQSKLRAKFAALGPASPKKEVRTVTVTWHTALATMLAASIGGFSLAQSHPQPAGASAPVSVEGKAVAPKAQ